MAGLMSSEVGPLEVLMTPGRSTRGDGPLELQFGERLMTTVIIIVIVNIGRRIFDLISLGDSVSRL